MLHYPERNTDDIRQLQSERNELRHRAHNSKAGSVWSNFWEGQNN